MIRKGALYMSKLQPEQLQETAQCKYCFATYSRASLDWSKKQEVQIGTNDSWGNWRVFSSFLKCSKCGELAVGDEIIVNKK